MGANSKPESPAASTELTSPTRKVRGPYARSAGVRRRIVRAAIEVFGESGFRAGTMKEIASRAGISQRGLVHHFPAKEDLLAEVLSALAEDAATLMEVGTPSTVLRSVVEIMADNARHPRLVELNSVLAAEATANDHPAHMHHSERLDAWRVYLELIFAELSDQGLLITGLSPSVAAATLVAIQDGIQLQWLYNPEAIDMTSVVRSYISSVAPGLALDQQEEARPVRAASESPTIR